MAEGRIEALAGEYREGRRSREEVFSAVAELLYREPEDYGFEDEDAAAEALLRHRDRILGLVDRYVSRGSSFEAYLASSLRFIAKSMRRSRRREAERELACERSEALRLEGREAAEAAVEAGAWPARPARPAGSETRRKRRALGNRLVYLYLKCAWDAGELETRRVAEAAGVSPEWLAAAQSQSRRFLEAERNRYERLASRRDRSWARLRILEQRLSGEPDPARRAALGPALERARRSHEAALAELGGFRPLVPNSIVARILGVPKGTVDSGIYYLKHADLRIRLPSG